MNWLFTVLAAIMAYSLFTYFGFRAGGAESFHRAALAPVSSPINFLIIMFGNVGFGLAVFYALKISPFAVTIVLALGVLVSFIFSALVADHEITGIHAAGVVTILIGIWLLR